MLELYELNMEANKDFSLFSDFEFFKSSFKQIYKLFAYSTNQFILLRDLIDFTYKSYLLSNKVFSFIFDSIIF